MVILRERGFQPPEKHDPSSRYCSALLLPSARSAHPALLVGGIVGVESLQQRAEAEGFRGAANKWCWFGVGVSARRRRLETPAYRRCGGSYLWRGQSSEGALGEEEVALLSPECTD